MYVYKHTYKFPLASASSDKHLIFVSKSVLVRNEGDAKPDFCYCYVAPTALGPVSYCTASEAHDN